MAVTGMNLQPADQQLRADHNSILGYTSRRKHVRPLRVDVLQCVHGATVEVAAEVAPATVYAVAGGTRRNKRTPWRQSLPSSMSRRERTGLAIRLDRACG
jgi:hypothetical protein